MKNIARLYLSLEKLFLDPVTWMEKKPWGMRMVLAILLIPMISLSSIFIYDNFRGQSWTRVEELLLENQREISTLKNNYQDSSKDQITQIEDLNKEVAKLKIMLDQSASVLGASETEDSTTEQSSGENKKMIFVPSGSGEIPVFDQPLKNAKQITTLSDDSFYFYLQKQENWFQVDLEDNLSGWINDKFAAEFP